MSILRTVKTGPTVAPPRILLHGQEGVGKTTWAARIPGSLTLTAEDGGGDLDYARAEVPTWAELRAAVRELLNTEHNYRTVVVDTIDTYQGLLWEHICKQGNVSSIEEMGYGKGYTQAAEEMGRLAVDLDLLRSKRSMAVVLLAHSHVKRFDDPMGNPFDRYEIRLHKQTASIWTSWADGIFFAAFEVTVKVDKRATVLDKGKATGGKRVLYTTKDPAYDAKNRWSLPEELPLTFEAFAKAFRWEEREKAWRPSKHHQSWEGDRAAFCAELTRMGTTYDAVAARLEAAGIRRPSAMSGEERARVLSRLRAGQTAEGAK